VDDAKGVTFERRGGEDVEGDKCELVGHCELWLKETWI
jgi:hypothetical protein